MERKENYATFQQEIGRRGIEHLIHFTPTINLLSIFEQGKLLSRSLLEANDIDDSLLDFIEFLDGVRYDDKRYINLSISSPNSFLFNRFQERAAEKHFINWCVLKIDPQYIYQKHTLFSVTNAASSLAKHSFKITGDFEKFSMLFAPQLALKFLLNRGTLPLNYPTDVQAEVLVKDMIEATDIIQVCFKDGNELATAKAALNNYNTANFVIEPTLFAKQRIV